MTMMKHIFLFLFNLGLHFLKTKGKALKSIGTLRHQVLNNKATNCTEQTESTTVITQTFLSDLPKHFYWYISCFPDSLYPSIIKPIGREDCSSVVTTQRLHVWSLGEGGRAVWIALPTIGGVGNVGTIVTKQSLQNWSTDMLKGAMLLGCSVVPSSSVEYYEQQYPEITALRK